MAVEILLPEHYCSYGSKPGWFWASFWLFLTAENQAGPKKVFFVKKMGIWGSTVVAVEIPLPEHCCGNGSKPRWIWGPFWLFLTVENPAGPKKDFNKKNGCMGVRGCAPICPPFLRKKYLFDPACFLYV